ncbi:LysR family transcriptional regulator ArgP [Bifidobacterium crudilactis]|jgi:LysR family transcriptional regulator (chromosome initiation inhibitor)|uniref:LysR family transcriptional regulator ArgP n=1 Tax=Bifidobacterium crudilactis TaxID=327277 RepID=UPI0023577D63|nr:LysR family transcriptional regulator ArgP [Bifidobacterium crudilactis]MCI1218760.1 LysR family transcriptional regulator ArgP [Bifidobacterium crudilactis]
MNEYRGDSPNSAANIPGAGSSTTDGISLLEAHDLSARIRAIPIEQLMALQSIIEEGSFDAAADVMHISQSAISQRIKSLESQVGHIVIQRSKPVQATAMGQLLLRLARQITLAQEEAAQRIESEQRSSTVNIRIVVNADSLEGWVLPALAPVVKQSIAIDIKRQDEHISTRLLRSGEAMAAITAEDTPVQGCTMTKLGSMAYFAAATPEFAERWFPEGLTRESLEVAPLVQYDRDDQLQYHFIRRITRAKVHPPMHFVPTSTGYNDAVSLGFGWGLIPSTSFAAYPRNTLVRLSPQEPLLLPLFWQQWKLSSPALDTVAQAIIRASASALVQD